jgi:DNA-binding NarL/FixJ family response regulator
MLQFSVSAERDREPSMTVALREAPPSLSGSHHTSKTCALVVIDTQPLIRAGLVSLIQTHLCAAEVAYSGSSVREGVATALRYPGACVILGTRQHDPSGYEVESIAAFAMHGIPVLVLVDRPSMESMEAANIAGARGYLDKESTPAEFIEAIRMLTSGRPCPPSNRFYPDSTLQPTVRLSDQERRALVLYASGLTQDVVARRMGIASNTVKHYLDRVRDKYSNVGVRARTKLELHALARAEGLLP